MSPKIDLKDPFLNLHKFQFLGLFLKSILAGRSMLQIQRGSLRWHSCRAEVIHRNHKDKGKKGTVQSQLACPKATPNSQLILTEGTLVPTCVSIKEAESHKLQVIRRLTHLKGQWIYWTRIIGHIYKKKKMIWGICSLHQWRIFQKLCAPCFPNLVVLFEYNSRINSMCVYWKFQPLFQKTLVTSDTAILINVIFQTIK